MSARALPADDDIAVLDGMRMYKLDAAFVAASANFYVNHPTDARALLAMQRDAGPILARLLAGGHTAIAGRIAGAFRNIGADRVADDIMGAMKAAGHTVRETDPFEGQLEGYTFTREPSPYAHRIRLMWNTMRKDIIGKLPAPAARRNDIDAYPGAVDDIYVTDAYHSLSIEGYRVTPDLIERVRRGNWNPDKSETDLASRWMPWRRAGYHLCFQEVRKSVERVLKGDNAGKVVDDDHASWYRQMFGPGVEAGLVRPENLAGYRNGQVYIRGSQHRPLNVEAVRDTMPVFFESADAGTGARGADRPRSLHVRLHPPLHGREWPHGPVPHECHDGCRWL